MRLEPEERDIGVQEDVMYISIWRRKKEKGRDCRGAEGRKEGHLLRS